MVGSPIGAERGVEGAVSVEPVVDDNSGQGTRGACPWMPRGAVGDGFPSFAVLLSVEGERGVGGTCEVSDRTVEQVESAVADEETGVSEAEGIIVCGLQIFPGAEEVEETK